MRRTRLRRPSPALVIASLALVFAMAGTGYATGLQVPRGSVGTPQLRNGAVTTPKIANNSITSAKVRNGTLVAADFARGQLPAGPAGPAGPPGVAGVERNQVATPSNSTNFKGIFLACPEGKRLIGGGALVNPVNTPVAIVASYPDNDNVWRAFARETTAFAGSWSLTVYTICATVAG